MSETLDKHYRPTDVETRWYQTWEAEGCFKPEAVAEGNGRFVIVIPPPNVTGALHMGHALNNTLQDVLVRFERMRGKQALWVPGTDHAGIATQNVVEKALAKEGISRDDLGREAFIQRTWEWKEQYGGRIIEQLKRLGASCDWDRLRFTMDEGLSRAVVEAFVRLYEKELIYRGERLINWCPRCLTALSDEEAEPTDEAGRFWHLKYPVKGSPDRFVVVATTRPETMLGDTAVAVHESDERYADLVGEALLLPLVDREIPVIIDEHADPTKGSGAVKITPAHDFNDFEVGNRHDLPRINVFTEDAKVNENGGPYAGLDRFEARKKVLEDLEALGLVAEVEDKEIALPRCYRCSTVVEPYLSRQWFVKMRPLLEPAAAAVKDGRMRVVPDRYARTYLDWVEQYRDWCISRQIWWGHRIPVWYDEDDVPAASSEPLEIGGAHPKTGKPIVRQDPDVLDTWFSSQLWPFSVMGWPDDTPDLEAYYPTDVLVTARDIIYFWVARMVMCGLEFRDELPYHTVYINGTVLDERGRRMSKSLGNGIDPLEMGDRYGMDAVRWTLLLLTTEGQDIKLSESRFEGGRNFINKLWNASRFVLMNLDGYVPTEPVPVTAPEDRWVLSRLSALVRDVTDSTEAYRFHEIGQKLYAFTWNVYCDWYLELTKGRMNDTSVEGAASRKASQQTLVQVLDTLLRLLHPVIPYVTEELRSHLKPYAPNAGDRLILDAWPEHDPAALDPAAEAEVDQLISLVTAARVVRDRMGVSWKQNLDFVVRCADAEVLETVESVKDRAMALGRVATLTAGTKVEKPATASTVVEDGLEIFIPLEGLIDLDAERARLEKEIAQHEGWLKGIAGKLSNAGFVANAPADVVERERSRQGDLEEKLGRLRDNRAELG
ncbi:MAG: valine--tRNA ligase [Planctomycetota bacterium]|nr:valine--tRNA ligase [Planctomycetota bacterium]